MAEYIEREALLMWMDKNIYGMRSRYGHDDLLNHAIDLVQNARDFVAAQKVADVAPVVHGRWIDNVDKDGFLCNAWRKCSACGCLNFSKKPPYCPNCGARMQGGTDE